MFIEELRKELSDELGDALLDELCCKRCDEITLRIGLENAALGLRLRAATSRPRPQSFRMRSIDRIPVRNPLFLLRFTLKLSKIC